MNHAGGQHAAAGVKACAPHEDGLRIRSIDKQPAVRPYGNSVQTHFNAQSGGRGCQLNLRQHPRIIAVFPQGQARSVHRDAIPDKEIGTQHRIVAFATIGQLRRMHQHAGLPVRLARNNLPRSVATQVAMDFLPRDPIA